MSRFQNIFFQTPFVVINLYSLKLSLSIILDIYLIGIHYNMTFQPILTQEIWDHYKSSVLIVKIKSNFNIEDSLMHGQLISTKKSLKIKLILLKIISLKRKLTNTFRLSHPIIVHFLCWSKI